jgi:FKBP12-rapamycin complex-associated protein
LKFAFFSIQVSTSEMLVSNAAQSLEEFYPSVAIATLMRIIRDPNLHQHHNQVINAKYRTKS